MDREGRASIQLLESAKVFLRPELRSAAPYALPNNCFPFLAMTTAPENPSLAVKFDR